MSAKNYPRNNAKKSYQKPQSSLASHSDLVSPPARFLTERKSITKCDLTRKWTIFTDLEFMRECVWGYFSFPHTSPFVSAASIHAKHQRTYVFLYMLVCGYCFCYYLVILVSSYAPKSKSGRLEARFAIRRSIDPSRV